MNKTKPWTEDRKKKWSSQMTRMWNDPSTRPQMVKQTANFRRYPNAL